MANKSKLSVLLAMIVVLVPLGFEVSGYESLGLAIFCWSVPVIAAIILILLWRWPKFFKLLKWGNDEYEIDIPEDKVDLVFPHKLNESKTIEIKARKIKKWCFRKRDNEL